MEAAYCHYCGVAVESSNATPINTTVPPLDKNPTFALLLSIIPGLGQVYCGRYLRGAGFFIGTLSFLLLIYPGLFLWIAGALDAYTLAARREEHGLQRE